MYSLIHYGRRLLDLQKCRSLRISSVNLFQNDSAFSNSFFSTSSGDGKGQNFTVSYLVESLGLASKLAESISKKVTFENKANPDTVLSLLRSHGFTDSQISDIVTDYPQLLIEDAEKSLAPKLQSLQSRGASISELTKILSKVPKILELKEDKTISVYYDFVKEVIEADKSFEHRKLSPLLPQGSVQENKIRNVSVLREVGVSQRLLFSLLMSDDQIVCGKERFEESLKKVVEMGFDPTTSKFVEALKVFYKLSDETIQEKLCVLEKRLGFASGDVWEIFKKSPIFLALSEKKIANSVEAFVGLGFSRDEITRILKNFPWCVNLSAETVKKKTEFLVKKMNWPLKAVALSPQVLGYSMEKRIVPRCNVIKALMSKGSKLPSMEYVLKSTNEVFLNRFVRKLDDKELVAVLLAIFTRDHAS
ncbi:unnamed protein product [Microthlaspi erraticum]|uniref:Mitochondrial transcription termination factor family protein n=1 Tax=Microthlaspi erraticum TaxID=1685480 RepID=A0A6D2IPJ3_9BRAS|nr:unnamed protein product [Microthlaspi erraticum]